MVIGNRNSLPQLSRLNVVRDPSGLENESFENMVLHHRRALMRINAGASSCKVLSKRDREHMRKLGILHLTFYQGRRYVLTLRAKRVLGIST